MIGIIDYGSGNIQAIKNIYNRLNIPAEILSTPESLESAERLLLPGVGAFDATMNQLISSGLKDKLDELVLERKRKILGICVGMQILAQSSEEGHTPGLGWLAGRVKRFNVANFTQKPYLPHMGWNTVEIQRAHPIFDGIDHDMGFYFVHSYFFDAQNVDDILSLTHYGTEFASGVASGNVFGFQFHPEKSHSNGVRLLENFAKI
ncbi:Imidazole glycerol phosphate synthase amidotransferase subunit [Mariniradius saccharolyticus AK6]|uniref:Imidazole glycerol phosphate synthase subunit HisH n=1 Tax=Mariniradius saccharolyticus AK6 TaxID=1239962 RepID=M7XVB0_9BACT|nr:imidazole glycerol phosphate synthase subunit HisH [Mariniradius saccharolyticus]EMS32417.1 Imidazole glycerol phosphate synthase amidotransferase subunit [Mariniradius saccharolyticus AK6]